jgi:hypothetical protein
MTGIRAQANKEKTRRRIEAMFQSFEWTEQNGKRFTHRKRRNNLRESYEVIWKQVWRDEIFPKLEALTEDYRHIFDAPTYKQHRLSHVAIGSIRQRSTETCPNTLILEHSPFLEKLDEPSKEPADLVSRTDGIRGSRVHKSKRRNPEAWRVYWNGQPVALYVD